MAERKFYKTVIKVTILSEDRVLFDDLEDVHHAINEDCVGIIDQESQVALDEGQLRHELLLAGEDETFFHLLGEEDGQEEA
jgi:hypothetical protein